jgi:hypothetical protein
MFDLQIIGGRLNSEIDKLPSPYRESIRPFFREQLFGKHHQLLAMHRTRAFAGMTGSIRDPETFRKFCEMLPEGVFRGMTRANATRTSGIRRTVSSIT